MQYNKVNPLHPYPVAPRCATYIDETGLCAMAAWERCNLCRFVYPVINLFAGNEAMRFIRQCSFPIFRGGRKIALTRKAMIDCSQSARNYKGLRGGDKGARKR
jgi:hypothetical protein